MVPLVIVNFMTHCITNQVQENAKHTVLMIMK